MSENKLVQEIEKFIEKVNEELHKVEKGEFDWDKYKTGEKTLNLI
jgi:hypothetical protein